MELVSFRVLLADDHIPTRDGIRRTLEEHGLIVCAEVDSARLAVVAATELAPDVCLLGAQIRGDAITAVRQIDAALPRTRIVMLGRGESDDVVFAALRAGAVGYLSLDADPARLGFAVEGVVKGEAAIPRHLVTRIVAEFRFSSPRAAPPAFRSRGIVLSAREWEVLDLLRRGHTTKAIAQRLGLRDVTVRRHISAALRKLRVTDRAAAIKLLDDLQAVDDTRSR